MALNVEAGYNDAYVITKSDTVNAAYPFDAVYVGSAGAVVVVLGDNKRTTVQFNGVIAGQILPIAGVRINSTNTVPSDFVGLRRI